MILDLVEQATMTVQWIAHAVLAATPAPTETPAPGGGGIDTDWAAVCPTLPGKVAEVGRLILSWAKGFFLIMLPVGALSSLAMVVVGTALKMRQLAGSGGVGLVVVFVVAVVYAVIWAVFAAILPTECR